MSRTRDSKGRFQKKTVGARVTAVTISVVRPMEGDMLGIPMPEYWAMHDRLLAMSIAPEGQGRTPYVVDSIGRPWSVMLDRSGIYLIGDVTACAKPRSGPQQGMWTA